jgi:hypothetical protein
MFCFEMSKIFRLFQCFLLCFFIARFVREPVSLVAIMSGYGLNDRAIEVRSSAEAKDFSSSLCVQTGSGDHLASCIMGTVGPFLGTKARPGRDAATHSHLVPRMSRSYSFSPPKPLRGVRWGRFSLTRLFCLYM